MKPSRDARRKGSGIGPGSSRHDGTQSFAEDETGDGGHRPLTREAVLRALVWTGASRPGGATEAVEPQTRADTMAAGTTGEAVKTGGERVACPPAAAAMIAEQVLASLDPGPFLDLLVELAHEHQPVGSVEWLDLLDLVRNKRDGHGIALARGRILAQGRAAQRAQLLKDDARDRKLDLPDGGAEAVARRSLSEDGDARRAVKASAARQRLTLADCDARALQRQLDILMKLDLLVEGAQRRTGRVQERMERRIVAANRLARDVVRERELRERTARQDRREEERLVLEREQQEELRQQWKREAQAHQEDRAWTHEKRARRRRHWQHAEAGTTPERVDLAPPVDLAPADPATPSCDTPAGKQVEVLGGARAGLAPRGADMRAQDASVPSGHDPHAGDCDGDRRAGGCDGG